jgi:putative PIN family toxin of toxin-antitoxin system
MRVVVDTGVYVSALIRRQSTPGEVLNALRDGRFKTLYSTDMLIEIIEVLGRPALRLKYHIEPDDSLALLNLIRLRGELVTPTRRLSLCRDPKDDKFLEAALAGSADCLVSGDADLLDLGTFENIPILRPAEFLARFLPMLSG